MKNIAGLRSARVGGWILGIALFFVLFFFFLLTVMSRIEEQSRNQAIFSIKSVLGGVQQSLVYWKENRLNGIKIWVLNDEINYLFERQLQLPRDAKSLRQSPYLKKIREYFMPYLKEHNDRGIFLISPDFINVASMRDGNLGETNLIHSYYKDKLLQVFRGDSVLIPPIHSELSPASFDSVEIGNKIEPTMFLAVPIKDKQNRVIAAFTIRLDPEEEFNRILNLAESKSSIETYLVNSSGRLLTKLKYPDILQKRGILGEGESGVLKLVLRDPGKNIYKGKIGRPLEELSLTLAAESVMKHAQNKISTGIQIYKEGYRDYRGVKVLGGWIWNEDLCVGIITEIDESEALREFNETVVIIAILFFLVTFLFVLFWFVIHSVQSKNANEIRRSRDILAKSQDVAAIGSWEWEIGSDWMRWSDQTFKIFGMNPGDVTPSGMEFINRVHPDDKTRVRTNLKKSIEEKKFHECEHRIIRPDGSIRTVFEKGSIESGFDENKNIIVGVIQDITERKNDRLEIERNVHLLNTIQEAQKEFIANIGTTGTFKTLLKAVLDVTKSEYGFIGEIGNINGVKITGLHEIRRGSKDETQNEFSCGCGDDEEDGNGYLLDMNGEFFMNSLQTQNHIIINDSDDPRLKNLLHSEWNPLKNFMAILLLAGDNNPLGILLLGDSKNGYDKNILKLLQPFVSTLISITNAYRSEKMRKLAEEELKAAKAHLEQNVEKRTSEIKKLSYALENSPSMTVITNKQGVIEYVNPQFCMDTGYEFEEVIGKDSSIMGADNMTPFDYEKLWKTISSGNKWVGEFHNRKKNGDRFWTLAAISPLKNENGEITNFISTQENMDHLKRVEEKLNKARKEAIKANLAKSEFLSRMSHELRTPMNSILGFAQLLKEESEHPLTEEQIMYNDYILKGGQHLLKLINEVLDLAKIESESFSVSIEDVSISEIINECVEFMQSVSQKHSVRIYNNCENSRLPIIMADYTRIKQVLLNLMSNGIKYNKKGGSLFIDSYEDTASNNLRIIIRDTGRGIPEELQQSLFEPFNRLGAENESIEGTGIGLTITKRLVEYMNGRIGLESTVGEGSSFWVEFAISKNTNFGKIADFDGKPISDGVSSRNAREHFVLYVEDNKANLQLMKGILNRIHGVTLISAHNAEFGIELAIEKKPDMIIMDVNLPGIDGFEALKILKNREETRDIPIIALSANAMTNDIAKGLKAGFLKYLTKPIDVKTITESVQEILYKNI